MAATSGEPGVQKPAYRPTPPHHASDLRVDALAVLDWSRPGPELVRARVPARWPIAGLAAVEGPDQGVGAVVETGRVVVPDPHVQGDQVRVPEVERRAGLGAALGALVLRAGEHEGAVLVVAGRAEGPIGGARQRRGGRLLEEHPLQGAELPAPDRKSVV